MRPQSLEQFGRSVFGNLVLTLDRSDGTPPSRMRMAVLNKREVNPTRGALWAILLVFGSLVIMEAQEALMPGSARKPARASSSPSTSGPPAIRSYRHTVASGPGPGRPREERGSANSWTHHRAGVCVQPYPHPRRLGGHLPGHEN